MRSLAFPLAAAALLSASPAVAQTEELYEEPSRFTFHVGGGFSFVAGDAADRFDAGGVFQIGGGLRLRPGLAVQLTYQYSGYGVDENVLPEADLEADHALQLGALEVVYEPALPLGPVAVYLVAGPGLYYRVVSVRRITGTAVVPYCDPWLFYCAPTAVETSEVLGTRDDWNFGVGGGIGVIARLSPYVGFFIEGRYQYVFGDEVTDAQGDRRDSDTQYIPIVAGFRF